MVQIPIGERESIRLEFKSAAALRDPDSLGREVVAFLNAEGGTLWVGIREADGVAVEVERIKGASEEGSRLRNHLIDTIEPPLSEDEVRLDDAMARQDGLLRVLVKPRERNRPYAQLRRGGRFYWTRIADRLRPMSREEISGCFAKATEPELVHDATVEQRLLDERKVLLERQEHRARIRLQPEPEFEVDLHDQRLREYLTHPMATANREAGWNFVRPHLEPALRQEMLVQGSDGRKTEIRRDGGIVFEAQLESFHWKGAPNELWPYALLELPISLFRLAKCVWEGELAGSDYFWADFLMIGLKGWSLRPFSPKAIGFLSAKPVPYERDDYLASRPWRMQWADLTASPDRCAMRLVERFYEAFGYSPGQVPGEYDPEEGRFELR